MAMAPVPTTTRLLTTVNARYYPVEGVADAYCLDGKFPGKRELRAVNTTQDREGRGFLVSVFAYPSDARNRVSAWQEPLKKLAGQINSVTGDIDTDINDLAETALDVTGGLKLSGGEAREPYFAGVVVRDGELAAVTVGEGLAFIYRQDVLYPLTGNTKTLDPIDLFGDQVEGIEDFIAGEAGAIRYSNIAQVEAGDVFVLCNGELFDVIGQKELMRLLSESEDQLDAAASLLTAAASQMPGTPIQVAVSKVDELKTSEQAPKFSLGRFATQAMEPVVVPEPAAADPGLARTQRYERQDMVDRTRRKVPQDSGGLGWDLPPLPVSEATEPFETVVPHIDRGGREDFFDEGQRFPVSPSRDEFGESDIFSDPAARGQEDDLPVFAYSQAAQRRKIEQAPYDDYERSDAHWDTGDEMGGGRQAYDPYGDYDDYDDDYGRKPRGRGGSDRTRRIIFYAILITIILICIVALIKLLSGDKKPAETDPPISEPPVIESEEPTPSASEEEPEPTDTDPVETDPGDSVDKIHVVVEGDTWWGICSRYYDRASETLCEKLAEYNNKSVSNLFVGNEIAIPPLSELLGD